MAFLYTLLNCIIHLNRRKGEKCKCNFRGEYLYEKSCLIESLFCEVLVNVICCWHAKDSLLRAALLCSVPDITVVFISSHLFNHSHLLTVTSPALILSSSSVPFLPYHPTIFTTFHSLLQRTSSVCCSGFFSFFTFLPIYLTIFYPGPSTLSP